MSNGEAMGILPEAERAFWALTCCGFHACHSQASKEIPARRLAGISLRAVPHLQTCVTIQ